MEDVQKAIIATICVLVLAGGGTLNNISERAEANGDEIEQNQVLLGENKESLMVQSSITENLTEEVQFLKSGPEWVNVIGDRDQTWSISLNQSQWLEVMSFNFVYVETGDGQDSEPSMQSEDLLEESGYEIRDHLDWGFSPIFGGNWNIDMEQLRDGTKMIQSWSLVYRIHEV